MIYKHIVKLRQHRLFRQTSQYRRRASLLHLPPHPPTAGSTRHSALRQTCPLSTEYRQLGSGPNHRKGMGSGGHNGVAVEVLEILPRCLAPLDDGF